MMYVRKRPRSCGGEKTGDRDPLVAKRFWKRGSRLLPGSFAPAVVLMLLAAPLWAEDSLPREPIAADSPAGLSASSTNKAPGEFNRPRARAPGGALGSGQGALSPKLLQSMKEGFVAGRSSFWQEIDEKVLVVKETDAVAINPNAPLVVHVDTDGLDVSARRQLTLAMAQEIDADKDGVISALEEEVASSRERRNRIVRAAMGGLDESLNLDADEDQEPDQEAAVPTYQERIDSLTKLPDLDGALSPSEAGLDYESRLAGQATPEMNRVEKALTEVTESGDNPPEKDIDGNALRPEKAVRDRRPLGGEASVVLTSALEANGLDQGGISADGGLRGGTFAPLAGGLRGGGIAARPGYGGESDRVLQAGRRINEQSDEVAAAPGPRVHTSLRQRQPAAEPSSRSVTPPPRVAPSPLGGTFSRAGGGPSRSDNKALTQSGTTTARAGLATQRGSSNAARSVRADSAASGGGVGIGRLASPPSAPARSVGVR